MAGCEEVAVKDKTPAGVHQYGCNAVEEHFLSSLASLWGKT